MFYFILHPILWKKIEDSQMIFNAVRLNSGVYIVSWSFDGCLFTHTYEVTEVTEFLAKGQWVMTDEYGNY